MAKVSSLILCENVQPSITQNANGGVDIRPNITSPLTSIRPYAVPGNYSFAIFFSICDTKQDAENGQGNLKIRIYAPSEDVVFTSADIVVPPEVLLNEESSYSLDLRNFVFKQKGTYAIKIFFNEKEIAEHHFEVMGGV